MVEHRAIWNHLYNVQVRFVQIMLHNQLKEIKLIIYSFHIMERINGLLHLKILLKVILEQNWLHIELTTFGKQKWMKSKRTLRLRGTPRPCNRMQPSRVAALLLPSRRSQLSAVRQTQSPLTHGRLLIRLTI